MDRTRAARIGTVAGRTIVIGNGGRDGLPRKVYPVLADGNGSETRGAAAAATATVAATATATAASHPGHVEGADECRGWCRRIGRRGRNEDLLVVVVDREAAVRDGEGRRGKDTCWGDDGPGLGTDVVEGGA